jgi:hypothetical protein
MLFGGKNTQKAKIGENMREVMDFIILRHENGYDIKKYPYLGAEFVYLTEEKHISLYLKAAGYKDEYDFKLKTGIEASILLNVWHYMCNDTVITDFYGSDVILTINEVYPMIENIDAIMEKYVASTGCTRKEAQVARVYDFLLKDTSGIVDSDFISTELCILKSQVLLILHTLLLQDKLKVSNAVHRYFYVE